MHRYFTANGLPTTKENVFGGNIEYRYDGIDRLESVTYPGDAAPAVQYAYDAANRVTRIENDLYQSSFAYNRANQVTRITRGEIGQTPFQASGRGAQTEYGYWGHSGELRSIEHKWNLSAKRTVAHAYSYNADGLRKDLLINKNVPGSANILKVTYEYDNLNRLIGEYGYDAELPAASPSVYERLYHYDGSGNADRIVFYDRGVHWTGWTCDYNDQNELTQRYANLIGFASGSEGEARWSYTYDANGNLTQKKQETLSGSWGESLKWDYTWDVRNQMSSASKYVSSSYAGKVEYRYSHAYRGQRTERILYDSSNNIISWKRYVNDGLLIYRVEERYDSDQDGIDSSDPWRLKEEKFYRPGQIGNLFYKDVYYYPSDTSSANSTSRTFHYGYDAVGNVILVNEEYCGGTSFTYAFMQDAFGNQLDIGVFSGDDWWDAAADDCVYEHQTGKEFDTFTGLYFFHHRWYDPVVGRFVSRDLFIESPHAPPYSFVYVRNNPLMYVDIAGLQPSPVSADLFTGGLPNGWYKKTVSESDPKCCRAVAKDEWDRKIVDAIQWGIPGACFSCSANIRLLIIKKPTVCWTCKLHTGYGPSSNPASIIGALPIIGGRAWVSVHQYAECKLTCKGKPRPWHNSRNPILDHWWGSSFGMLRPGLSGADMRAMYPWDEAYPDRKR